MEYRCLCCDAPAEEFGPYRKEDRLCERCATEYESLRHEPREPTYLRVMKTLGLIFALLLITWGICYLFC